MALNEEIILSSGELNSLGGEFPSYVDYVIEEAVGKCGFSEVKILSI